MPFLYIIYNYYARSFLTNLWRLIIMFRGYNDDFILTAGFITAMVFNFRIYDTKGLNEKHELKQHSFS